MVIIRFHTAVLILALLIFNVVVVRTIEAQEAAVFDYTAVPGNNYDKAEFRLWYSKNVGRIQAIVLLMPGSNCDGRNLVDDPKWQEFATTHNLALVGCRFTDKLHDKSFIEDYCNVSKGSGQVLLDALVTLAGRAARPELASLPLLLWGMSAGGQFNYEFVAWKPGRVLAFVVNKGGVYYSALLSPAARNVPGMFFVGRKDLEFRTNTIVGLFSVNRRAGALWALVDEPSVAHVVGRSRDIALMFFEDLLPLRLANTEESNILQPIAENSGFIGDPRTKTYEKKSDTNVPNYPTSWLPTERTARAWQVLETEKAFDP